MCDVISSIDEWLDAVNSDHPKLHCPSSPDSDDFRSPLLDQLIEDYGPLIYEQGNAASSSAASPALLSAVSSPIFKL